MGTDITIKSSWGTKRKYLEFDANINMKDIIIDSKILFVNKHNFIFLEESYIKYFLVFN